MQVIDNDFVYRAINGKTNIKDSQWKFQKFRKFSHSVHKIAVQIRKR